MQAHRPARCNQRGEQPLGILMWALFLFEYARYMGWRNRDTAGISERICREYLYGERISSRDFLATAFGWFWGHTDNPALANGNTEALQAYMDAAYKRIRKRPPG